MPNPDGTPTEEELRRAKEIEAARVSLGMSDMSATDKVIKNRPDQSHQFGAAGASVEQLLSAFRPVKKLVVDPYNAYRQERMRPKVQDWRDQQARRFATLGQEHDAAAAAWLTGNPEQVPYLMQTTKPQNPRSLPGAKDEQMGRAYARAAQNAMASAPRAIGPITESGEAASSLGAETDALTGFIDSNIKDAFLRKQAFAALETALSPYSSEEERRGAFMALARAFGGGSPNEIVLTNPGGQ